MSKLELSGVSLFSGALGLDLGLEQAGIEARVTVECNPYAANTIRLNRPSIPIIEDRIENLSASEILKSAGLKTGEATVLHGGPSCQPFSNVGSRLSIGDPRGSMFREFIRIVREGQPRFFVMENVRGVLSAAIKHRPLIERGPGHPPITADEELGSAFLMILREFQELGYYTVFDLLNAADFGVPQDRARLVFIGSRDGEPIVMPKPTHAKFATEGRKEWVSLKAGLADISAPRLVYREFSDSTKQYLIQIPAGGNWRNLPEHLKAEAIGKAIDSWGGRGGFLRRLSWDRPSPTLTTDPNGRATMLCHPDEIRPLSVQEYGRLQQFPDGWEFSGSITQQYIQAGNAVPIGLGCAIGKSIITAMAGEAKVERLRHVVCANHELIERQMKLPRTKLNPPRMREVQDIKSAKQWMQGLKHHRKELLEFSGQKTLDYEDVDGSQAGAR